MFFVKTVELAIVLGLTILALAFKEVQTEGENPWAGKLPCWRKKVKWFPKEITGYHIGLVSYTLVLVWLTVQAYTLVLKIYGVIIPEGLFGTLMWVLASLIVLLSVFEDFCWHIVNPSKKYGLRTYILREYPATGGIYIWIMPIDYYFAAALSLVLAYIAGIIAEWLVIMAVLIFMIGVATVISTVCKQEV